MRYVIGLGSLLLAFILFLLSSDAVENAGDGGITDSVMDGLFFGIGALFFGVIALLTLVFCVASALGTKKPEEGAKADTQP